MKAVIELQFIAVMGMRISSKGTLIQKAIAHSIEENVKEITENFFSYFRDKGIETSVKYVMEGKSMAKITVEFLMITNIPVTKELLEKEKGLMASTDNTIGKLCNTLEEIFMKKGIGMKSYHKIYAD
jgi:hypothetical protein